MRVGNADLSASCASARAGMRIASVVVVDRDRIDAAKALQRTLRIEFDVAGRSRNSYGRVPRGDRFGLGLTREQRRVDKFFALASICVGLRGALCNAVLECAERRLQRIL